MRTNPFAQFQGVETDPAHSPSTTAPDGGEYGLPFEKANARPTPLNDGGFWWAASVDTAYITPSIGGKAGPSHGYGWTTGLRPRRERKAHFTGRTLVVAPAQARNPNVGQVGRDTRANDLVMRVDALSTDYLPSVQEIARSFTRQRGSAALQREITG